MLRSPRFASVVWFLGLLVCCAGVIAIAIPSGTEQMVLFSKLTRPRDILVLDWTVGQAVGGLLLAIGLVVAGFGLGLVRGRLRPPTNQRLKRWQIAAAAGLVGGLLIALVAPSVGSPYVGGTLSWGTSILMWGAIRTLGVALIVAGLTTFAVTGGLDAGAPRARSSDPTPA